MLSNSLAHFLLAKLVSRADGNETTLVVNRIGGNLLTGVNGLGSLIGYAFDDEGHESPFAGSVYGAQFREPLSNSFPKLDSPIEQLIAAGRSGWMKFGAGGDVGVLGAAINFNNFAGADAGAFNWGQNLRQLTQTAKSSLIMLVAPLNCANRPVLTSLSPDTATVGGGGLNLTVRGVGFTSGATVRWNGANRATTFVSATELNAVIQASDLGGGGSASVMVINATGGAPSNALAFALTQTCALRFLHKY